MKIYQFLPFLLSLSAVTLAQDFCNASGHSGEKIDTTGNKKGSIGTRDYEIWADGGNNKATFYADGSFSCSFSNSKDYLCRSGINISPAKTPTEIGHIKAEYKVVKSNAQNVGYSYVGVYGWTLQSGLSPVYEFYIVDNWLSPGRPGDWVGNEKKGDFTIDGGQYTVYKNTRNELVQYFSLRQQPRTCGTIDVTAHFEQWKKIGLPEPKITEIKVLGEAGNVGGGCSGSVDFPYAKIYIDGVEAVSTGAGGRGPGGQGGNAGGNAGGNSGRSGNGGGNSGRTGNGGGNSGRTGNAGGNSGNAGNAKCSSKIIQKGYKCCSDNCEVYYADDDGYWGAENNEWCGCGTEAPKCVGKQGFPCCKSTKEVVATDADGKWGVEDNNWCYIG